MSPQAKPTGPAPPRPTRHGWNLAWWVALVVAVVAVQRVASSGAPTGAVVELPEVTGEEREAWLALRFPRIGLGPGELATPRLRSQLTALRDEGFQTPPVDHFVRFHEEGTPLPEKPSLLVVGGAWTSDVEALDPILAELGLRALLVADAGELSRTNLSLVSIRRLQAIARSPVWELALDACPGGMPLPAERLVELRATLEGWVEREVVAASCSEPLPASLARALHHGLTEAGFRLALGPGRERANERADDPLALRWIRMREDWRAEEVVERIAAHRPRREPLELDFARAERASGLLVDAGALSIDEHALTLAEEAERSGGLVLVGGTRAWADTEVTVALAAPPEGQFWIYARHGVPSDGTAPSFVRLGVSEGRVLLQRSMPDGGTELVASRELPGPSATLSLRLLGTRALAEVDGQPLGERPAVIPQGLEAGSVALAVWSQEGTASARIARFRAAPVRPLVALPGAEPSFVEWQELRSRVRDLSVVAPTVLEWRDGDWHRREIDRALEIFAGHHRLPLQAAIRIGPGLPAEALQKLGEAARGAESEGASEPRRFRVFLAEAGLAPDVRRALERAGVPADLTVLDLPGRSRPGAKRSIVARLEPTARSS